MTAFKLARRELRHGLKGFRVFLACLAIGVAAIAGAGSLNKAVTEGLHQDARKLLGGDVEVRLTYRQAEPEQLAVFEQAGTVSRFVSMRAMARRPEDGGRRNLVEFKAVDAHYPLFGDLVLDPPLAREGLLEKRDGLWGAVVDRNLLVRLGLKVGDAVHVGDAAYQIRAVIVKEPDRVATVFTFGPRFMVDGDSVEETGLIQPGSQIRYDYLLALNKGKEMPEEFRDRMTETFPDAGWRIRIPEESAEGFKRFLGNMTLFLTLVGLTALLVGGIGVANGVKAYMDSRARTIAILKCVGATNRLVFQVYLIQISALALLGIAIGLVLGAVVPYFGAMALGDSLPVQAKVALYPQPLGLAALFGILIALVFALWPLSKVRDIPGAALFRNLLVPESGAPKGWVPWVTGVLALALAALTILSAENQHLAKWFVGVSAASMLLFRLVAVLVVRLAKRESRQRAAIAGKPGLRLALANLHRPGAATPSVVLSLGLGLTVLVTVALIEGNLHNQIGSRIPKIAPAFFFIDIQPNQEETFDQMVAAVPGAHVVERAPMVRGRIMSLAGVPVAEATVTSDKKWAVEGDRGFTQKVNPPEDARIVEGQWWPEDYQGPTLLSVADDVAKGIGLKIGDEMVVNVLGREIRGTVANTRQVDWSSLRMNFAFIFSPGTLDGAPRTSIATVAAPPEFEDRVELSVTDAMPNVSAIRIKQALEAVKLILGQAGVAIRASAAITLLAGGLVLAGAVAAGHRRRVYESVVLKVLGATRGDILKAFLVEYGILGAATGVIAAVLGSLAAWAVLTFIMHLEWTFLPWVAVVTVILCVAATLIIGFAGTWRALGVKASPLLRNE